MIYFKKIPCDYQKMDAATFSLNTCANLFESNRTWLWFSLRDLVVFLAFSVQS